jgi:hypothetical protein
MTNMNDNFNEKQISEFRNTVSSGFNSTKDVIPDEYINEELKKLIEGIEKLNYFIKNGKPTEKEFARLLTETPEIYKIIRLLLALPNRIVFTNGLEVTKRLPDLLDNAFYNLLIDNGFWDLISNVDGIEPLLVISLISDYSKRRSYHKKQKILSKVNDIVLESVRYLNSERTLDIELIDPKNIDNFLSPRFEFENAYQNRIRNLNNLIAFNGIPFAAIHSLYFTSIGGSQIRDLNEYYPRIQRELESIPTALIIIADGQGFQKISTQVLEDLFGSVYSVISVKQAEEGKLIELLRNIKTKEIESVYPLGEIIESLLDSNGKISVEELPVNKDLARIALARYVSANNELDLELKKGGEFLSWTRINNFNKYNELRSTYEPQKSIFLFCELLNGDCEIIEDDTIPGIDKIGITHIVSDSILSSELLVFHSSSSINDELIKNVALKSLSLNPESKIAVLLSKSEFGHEEESRMQSIQKYISVNVVTIGFTALLKLFTEKDHPRENFISILLQQADLTKISPFILHSATPHRIYYGRERESSIIFNTLSSNSVVILGSRRIGKTSFMRNVQKNLIDANYSVFYGDCQTVKDWVGFAAMARRNWDVDLSDDFTPQNMFELIDQLKEKSSSKKIIIMLDEIDQLLEWDKNHENNHVSEAFFKSCRAISQENRAQFVFSGERTIANTIWNPESPHWNFCRSLPLQQLDRESTVKLISEPLNNLQISFLNREKFEESIWNYTSGHPQLAQYLGDKIVKMVNSRNPLDRENISFNDVNAIVNSFEFMEHYLTTYWGQATEFEKLISILFVSGVRTPAKLIDSIQEVENNNTEEKVTAALKLLDLYGIIEQSGESYKLRASWFDESLKAYSNDIQEMIKRYKDRV